NSSFHLVRPRQRMQDSGEHNRWHSATVLRSESRRNSLSESWTDRRRSCGTCYITMWPQILSLESGTSYRLLRLLRECESAMGLDPDIGWLHVDTPNRSSAANDCQEILRVKVDAFVLDWLKNEFLRKADFWQDRDGSVRICTPLAVKLCETSEVWYRLAAPI